MIKLNACFAFFLLLLNLSLKSQSFLTLEGSQVLSNFVFTDSEGNLNKNFHSVNGGAYALGYRHCGKKGLILGINAGMRKAGSSLNDNSTTITWGLQYADARLVIGYEIGKWRFKPYVTLAPYYSYLLSANQNMSGLNFDLLADKKIKNTDYGLRINPGFRAVLSDYISAYAEFTYLKGLQNIEMDQKQTLFNSSYMISFGIAASFSKPKAKWIQEH